MATQDEKQERVSGNMVRNLRQRKGLSLAQLATLMETSKAQISKVENGRASVTVDWLERLASATNTTLAIIFQDKLEHGGENHEEEH